MADATALYISRLLESNPLREPVLRSMIRALHLPAGSHGLDAGGGIGLQALLLAEAVGRTGKITCLDLSSGLLEYAHSVVRGTDHAHQIAFQQGDVSDLPFDDQTFDWIWSVDCVGYPAADLRPLLAELVRVVKPGGTVALMGWSSQALLPGYPLLEARLNACCSQFAPYLHGQSPATHFLRALGHFQGAGLEAPTARTFVGEVQAPLKSAMRGALSSLFEMLWEDPGTALSLEEREVYKRLCYPRSPECILNLDDYYAFFTYTMFCGTRSAATVLAGP